jgi:nitrogen fixation/metabolism regulation signal transduction histidine kinase
LGFKILSTVLVVQVILIMVSAFTRLSLYEEAYGFTTLRLYSHAFIILLVVIFCLLLYKIYKDKRENTFAFRVFLSIILFLAGMNFLNPDAFIARRNIEQFATTGKLDVYYLTHLSSDAVPETIKMLDTANENLKKESAHELYRFAQDINSPYFSKWQSLNISRLRAEKILNSKMRELELYKDYQQTVLPQKNLDSVEQTPTVEK